MWETGTVFDLAYPEYRLINAYAAALSPISNAKLTFTNLDDPSEQYEITEYTKTIL